jgi:hypothetical protein
MIAAAAIRFEGAVWTLPRPAGYEDILRHILEKTGTDGFVGRVDRGFVDHIGRFVTPKAALKMARLCGQLRPWLHNQHELVPEDLV